MIQKLKSLIIVNLKEDYKIAKENNLKYYFNTYENLINKVENMSINIYVPKKQEIFFLLEEYIEEIYTIFNKKLDGTYEQAGNRINLLCMYIDFINELNNRKKGDENMTLNEAIKHCKEVARTNNCVKCKREHKQLAKWLEDYKKLLQKKKKQIFHIDDTVYMIDEDNRYFEDKIYKIEKLNGNYYYYGSNCDFEEKDIGDWVFESELYRELHLESIIEMNYDLP